MRRSPRSRLALTLASVWASVGAGVGAGAGGGGCYSPPCPGDPLHHVETAEAGPYADGVIRGGVLYVCGETTGVDVWRLDEAMLRVEQDLGEERGCTSMAISPDGGHLATGFAGVRGRPAHVELFSLADPMSPQSVGLWGGAIHVDGVALDEDRLFVAARDEGIVTLDFELSERGRARDEVSDTRDMVVLPDRLVVADGRAGLRVFDRDGDSLAPGPATALEGLARNVEVRGEEAFVTNLGFLSRVDISGPEPTLLEQIDTTGTALSVALVDDDLAFVADWDSVLGYAISADGAAAKPYLQESEPGVWLQVRTIATEGTEVVAIGAQGLRRYALDRGTCSGPALAVNMRTIRFYPDQEDIVVLVRNQGADRLTISSIGGSDPAVHVDTDHLEIEPGEEKAIEVLLDPTAPEVGSIVLRSDDADQRDYRVPYTRARGQRVGDLVPDLTTIDLDGVLWTNQSLEGSVALVHYFATW